MSFTTPTSVRSGMAIRILEVNGHPPFDLRNFDGDTWFVVDSDVPRFVKGCGRLGDGGVRFHEKDMDRNGKDILVWDIVRLDDEFAAIPASHY
jgi:hypothetical protein